MSNQKLAGINTVLSNALAALGQHPRLRRGLVWTGGGIIVIGVLGGLVLPPVLKSVAVDLLSDKLHRPVSLQAVHFNPYTLSLGLEGFSVKHQDGKGEFVGFDQFELNLSGASLLRGGVVVDALKLAGPRIQVTRLADGRYDISDLLDEWLKPDPEPKKPTPKFALNNIELTNGKLVLVDLLKQKTHTVSDLGLGIPFLSSLPYQTEITVQPHFEAKINGAPLQLKGETKPFSSTHESALALDLDKFDLTPYQDYVPFALPVRLASALLSSDLKLHFSQQPEKVATLLLSGGVQLDKLHLDAVHGADKQPLLQFEQLALALKQADVLNRKFEVEKIRWQGPEIHASVDAQGNLNWLLALERLQQAAASQKKSAETVAPSVAVPEKEAPAAGKTAPEAPLQWSLGEFQLLEGKLVWQDRSGKAPVQVEVSALNVGVKGVESTLQQPLKFSASASLDAGKALGLDKLEVAEGQVDLAKHEVTLAALNLSGLRVAASRAANGQIDWLTPPRLRAVAASKTPAVNKDRHADKSATKLANKSGTKSATPWRVAIGKFSSEKMQARFEDRSLSPAAVQTLDNVNLTLENFSTAKASPAHLTLSGKINQRGEVYSEGKVQLTPLKLDLGLETRTLPLTPFQPYINPHLNVNLTRGLFSSKGTVQLAEGKKGLDGGYRGQMTLADFAMLDKGNHSDFLKWKSLHVGGMDVRLNPMAVMIGEISLSDFYSLLILDSQGQLNVTQIVRKKGEAPVTKIATTETPATPVTETPADKDKPVAPPVPATTPATPAAPPLPVRISKITLQGGAVNFNDRFVKPNYSAHLTRLGGRVSNLSSAADTVADLDLRARYDTAPVQILGKLNPLAAKPFLDIMADVKGVEMTSFSPYSGKYAGYKIEKGKLSLNLNYKLENSQLSAENRLFIDQLTFGEKVESPTATSLPVGLAISLLKNRKGEIDLNLPISGSLQDPKFSIGGLIVQVIGNLFVKAVTSPFALLGSMFGGGDELSNVEFVPGESRLTPAAEKRLQNLAQALLDRPALKLEITGRIDPEKDKEGLKRVQGVQRPIAAQRRSAGSSADNDSSGADQQNAAEYERELRRAYKAANFPKPRNLVGMQKDLPVEEMEKLMMANTRIEADDLQQLAERRAKVIEAWLVDKGQVPLERIFLLAPKLKESKPEQQGNRADFSLR
jgi:uncharacterized protein involved in outer membrane biogenesis